MQDTGLFGKRIKQLRETAQKSQTELAEELGKNISTINRWENGVRIPPKKTINQIAEIFGVSAEWLVGKTNERNSKKCWAQKKFTVPVSQEDLYRLRGECVWLTGDEEEKWALVSKTEDVLYLSDGTKMPFYKTTSIQRLPSPMCYGIDSMQDPLSRSRLIEQEQVWAEEIGPDPLTKRRGWYSPSEDRSRFVGIYGDIFLVKEYGVTWVAFEDIC